MQGFLLSFGHRPFLLYRASVEHILGNAVLNERKDVIWEFWMLLGVQRRYSGQKRGAFSLFLYLPQPFGKIVISCRLLRRVTTWSQYSWGATLALSPTSCVTRGHSLRLSLLMYKMQGWTAGASGPPETSQRCQDH